jgi:hypothetical protein
MTVPTRFDVIPAKAGVTSTGPVVSLVVLAALAAFPAVAQSTGGTAPGTMTPPIPGNVPAKAAIAGSPAIGETSRDPGLAATNRASEATTIKPAPVPETTPPEQPPPQEKHPNKNYAGSTVAPAGDH